MSFLAPLFLLGGLAVALPVIFHLIRRSSKEQVVFSSLMFLQPVPPRVTKRSRLENVFLLLLRCLVICLLALGFSRPFVNKPEGRDPEADTGRKLIVLVDASASMKRQDLWQQAMDKAKQALRDAKPGDKAAVMTFDTRARTLLSFDQWTSMSPDARAGDAANRLAAASPTWYGTHLGSALISAAEAFADADKQGQNLGRRQIVLITDLQEGSRLDGLQGYDWPRGVEVQVQTVAPKKPSNAGLQWIVESDESVKSGTNLAARIHVSNSGNAQREQFQIHWDGVPGLAPLDVYVPPGQNRIVAAPPLPAGMASGKLMLTGDDDDFDNAVYVMEPGVDHVNVIYLGDDKDNDPAQPLFFLTRAFQQSGRQVVDVRTINSATPMGSNDLTAARLVIATGSFSDERIAVLQDFLARGGTVFFAMKSASSAAEVGRLAGAGAVSAEEVAPPNFAMLGTIDFSHPLFAPFADARYNDFTKIHFWKYRRLDAEKFPGARIAARFDSGDPAVLDISRGKGRLLVLAAGWQTADSQLALSSKFVPLLYSVLDLAGGIKVQAAQFRIGDNFNLADVITSAPAEGVTVRKPDGKEVKLPAGEMHFGETDQPGFYSVATQPPLRFAVNLDGAESRTGPLPGDELERLGVPVKTREVNVTQQVELKRRLRETELERQQKLWRWLTLAALMLLLSETWAAGWITRRANVKTEATA